MFDDTCYHLAFETRETATLVAELLNDDGSRELLTSLIFWDAKRPITTDVLNRLDLRNVAARRGAAATFAEAVAAGKSAASYQPTLAF